MQSDSDNLNDLERRLATSAPATDGLNADAMLFAAGRASARSGLGAKVWPPAFLGVFGLMAVFAGMWMNEHKERLALADRLRQPPTANPISPSQPQAIIEEYAASPGNLLEVHRRLEQDIDPLPAPDLVSVESANHSAEPDILRADSLNHMLDP